uniref:DZF domain-containing protein n=1 Tax=Parascaris equorum TaxID=6256 RepID=A0A914R558_PAREQ
LFVEKVLASHGAPLSPGDAVRRVFEAIASGDGRDVLADLSGQQREDITAGSQHALRLIAFNQMYKVLGVERLPDARAPPLSSLGDRKRPRDSNGSPDDGEVVDSDVTVSSVICDIGIDLGKVKNMEQVKSVICGCGICWRGEA